MNILNKTKNYFKDLDKETKRFVFTILIIIILCNIVNAFVFQLACVNGDSMYPTLKDSQILGINKLNDNYDRYSIIVFKNGRKNLIKRVIGLPGETIKISDNDIFINGTKISDPVNIDMMYYGIAENEIKLGNDEYFVLGDNRNNSIDSRFKEVGVVKNDEIRGKIVIRFIPFKKYK